MSNITTRLNKYISESGICSRREADRYIEQGNVFINGRRASVGDQVAAGATVRVNGQEIEPRDEDQLTFIALNKPVGVVSTTESTEKHNIVDFIKHGERIFPIGRLDKDSQGLIFLTNNGDLVNKILRAGNQHEKEYLVTVNKPITDAFIKGLMGGVPMLGVVTRKCKVTKVSPLVFKIVLVQGLNRQIRRMCEHFNYEAIKLERVRIMNVSMKGLSTGEWRDLSEKELTELLRLTADSSSQSPASAKKRRPAKASDKPWYKEKPKTAAGRGKKPAQKSASGKKPSGSAAAKSRPVRSAKPGTAKPGGAKKRR